MSRHILLILAGLIVATAGWAYHVNYKTITALDEVKRLRADIAQEHEVLQVLKIEWAYLNAPERLTRLVGQHQEALNLVPLFPESLGEVAEIPFPKGKLSDDDEDADAELSAVSDGLPLPATRPVAWSPE